MKVDGEEIKTTDEHPFWVVGKGWTGASHLKSGDILKLENGKKVKVDEVWIEKLITPVKVYNFEVADWHTYYVSDAGVLVHNKCVKVASKTLAKSGFINPNKIRYTQNSIKSSFSNGDSVYDTIKGLKSGKIKPGDIPEIRIFEKHGQLYTLDNRSLYAAEQAGVNVKYRMATEKEITNEAWKFTTKNNGTSIKVR